jgi:divalent metal cation (Fe/Co/Zn/Cd) transporter
MTESAREAGLRTGLRLEVFTVGWNVIEAVVAIGAGAIAGSVALVGFGLDSVIESTSGIALYHRLRGELRGDEAQNDRREKRALLFVGVSFFLIATYVTYESLATLVSREAPDHSLPGIVLAALSLIVMPLLGWRKLVTARALESRALRGDAMETFVCAYLSFALLVGLLLNRMFDWWWADPLAALAMLPLIIHEGKEALEESREDEGDDK